MSHPALSGSHVHPEPAPPTLNLVEPIDRRSAPGPIRSAGTVLPLTALRLVVLGGDVAARSRLAHLLTVPGVTTTAADERTVGPADTGTADLGLILLPTAEALPDLIRRLLTGRVMRQAVILSGPEQIAGSALVEALVAGADGWLGLDLSPEILLRSVRGILGGEAGISRRHVTELIASLRGPVPGPDTIRVAGLTTREHEIFLALTSTRSVRSIAASLSLSEGTVRWYTGRLLRKLEVSSRAELAGLLLDPGEPGGRHVVPSPALTAVPDVRSSGTAPVEAVVVPAAWRTLPRGELRVVQLVVTGLTNRQIAEALFLSKHTVDSHLKSAFSKLGVRSRVELTVLAHRIQA